MILCFGYTDVLFIDFKHLILIKICIFQLTHSYSQLVQYKNQFEMRFSASNLLHLNQLIYVIGKLINILGILGIIPRVILLFYNILYVIYRGYCWGYSYRSQ